MASRVRLHLPCPEATEPEQQPPPLSALTSDLLEEIFLRVASPADLARAYAACVSFRRIIADRSFLRRYRSIHPPLLLGLVSSSGFQPVEPPHPNADVARSVAFSFDFLPHKEWRLCDVRDGRVLVAFPNGITPIRDLAVCDPLSRRYLLLPPITDDLLASIGLLHNRLFHFDVSFSFIPSGGIEEETSFRVISWIQSKSRLGILIFSSDSGCWSVTTSINWGDIGLDRVDMMVSGQYAYGCFYWKICDMSRLIKLDMNSMQFCTVDLPPGHDDRDIVVVESEGSKVAMFSLLVLEGASVDYYTSPQNGSGKAHEWHMISTIPLPDPSTGECYIHGLAEEYIFIEHTSDEQHVTYSTFFSLEIKSFNIKRLGTSSPFRTYPYFGFPPFMSPRRI